MKKIVIFLALMISLMTFGLSNLNLDIGDYCRDETFSLMDVALDQGFSVEETTCIANVFYAECEGYDIGNSYADCLD